MEFSVMCSYHSYMMGARFKMWFTCICLAPEQLRCLKEITNEKDGMSVFQQRVIYALHNGDCRLSHRASGMVVFDGHEFMSVPEGDGVRVRFNDECTFLVNEQDVTDYTK